MTSVGQVIAGLRGVLARVSTTRRRLIEADGAWDRAASGYAATTAGSSQPEVTDLASLDSHARQRIHEADALIARCESTINAIIERLGGGGLAPAPVSTGNVAEAPLSRGQPGAKAEGRWRNGKGDDVVLRSGRGDPWWVAAERFARDRGLLSRESRASLDLSKHIEIKLAMRMRAPGEQCRRHEVVRMDREVCGTLLHQQEWALTCDKMLPMYLPPGATLTVVEPDGTRRTYVGDEDVV
jgi:hypothetical protein